MKFPIAILLSLSAATAVADPPRLCANKDEAARIAPALAKGPVGPVSSAALAQALGLKEALIVSSYDRQQAVGVSGASFAQVWGSLNAWGESMTLITKGGNVFEVTSKIPPGEPSKRSKFFNLKGSGAGLGGHLRPDLITAIYGGGHDRAPRPADRFRPPRRTSTCAREHDGGLQAGTSPRCNRP